MIELKIQIITLTVSFLYGIFFAFTVHFANKYLYQKNNIGKIIFTFFFTFFHIILYFFILKKINEAILHPYALLMLLLGFITFNSIYKLVAKHLKK